MEVLFCVKRINSRDIHGNTLKPDALANIKPNIYIRLNNMPDIINKIFPPSAIHLINLKTYG